MFSTNGGSHGLQGHPGAFRRSPIGIKRVEAAARLAERHDAHLTALLWTMEPWIPIGLDAPLPSSIVENLERTAAENAERAKATLEALLARQACRAECHAMRC
ncbi:hypothetical protein [Azospirillum doebereinerae]|uniref:Uncharacterized protein n=1 Tax=Azospirillum doebereinerae TaxID=92933 RepID=A0A3S1CHP0_9PROT|nr:hypothetical protein [Azospirillum doebereinerae]MCG5243878.1 hypothetical protein [Azospirillum doebereinerae]RUQ72795.1 hypothetical protein EJ913_09485 [Azospirillum doebereinerae]